MDSYAVEHLITSLQCPSCQQYMQPPILQCATGHSQCFTCCKKNNKCRCGIGIVWARRNLTLESLFLNLPLPCKNTKFGCTAIILGANLQRHELECTFEPCPVFCGWQGFNYRVHHHIKNFHSGLLFSNNGIERLVYKNFIEISTENSIVSNFFMEAYGELFQVSWNATYLKGYVAWCVFVLRPTNEEFEYRLTLENENPDGVIFKTDKCTVLRDALMVPDFYKFDVQLVSLRDVQRCCVEDALSFHVSVTKSKGQDEMSQEDSDSDVSEEYYEEAPAIQID